MTDGHKRIAADQCSCGASYSLRWMTWDEWWEAHEGDITTPGGRMSATENGGAYLPICGPCIRGEGSECHTPDCALFLRDVPRDGLIAEFSLDIRLDALLAALRELTP